MSAFWVIYSMNSKFNSLSHLPLQRPVVLPIFLLFWIISDNGEINISSSCWQEAPFAQSHFCNLAMTITAGLWVRICSHCLRAGDLSLLSEQDSCSLKAGPLLFVGQTPLRPWMTQIPCYLAVTPVWSLALVSSNVAFHGSLLLRLPWYLEPGLAWHCESLGSHQTALREFGSPLELLNGGLMALAWHQMSKSQFTWVRSFRTLALARTQGD